MPYTVKKDSRCPAGKPWAVVNPDTNRLMGCHPSKQKARDQQKALYVNVPDAAASAGDVTVPALVTLPGIDICAAGTWDLSTGEATFTTEDLAAAVEASQCPSVGPPVIKIGHVDPRFDGEPAVGHVTNLALAAEGNKLTGDLAGMPGWLGVVAESAYPSRSVEGAWDFTCQIGHVHPFVITGLALLGVSPPGVGVLGGLGSVAALYGVAASGPQGSGRVWHTRTGDPMAGNANASGITTEDVRRAYYGSGVAMSMWITEMQMDPPQLIVADEAQDKVFRVPFTIKNSAIAFGDAVEVEVEYVDVKAMAEARGSGMLLAFATAEDSRNFTAAWDGAAMVKNLGNNPTQTQISKLFALPGDNKSDSKLPHHTVSSDGTVGAADTDGCTAAIAALNGGRGGMTGVSAADKQKAYNHLAAHIRAAGGEPPDYTGTAAAAAEAARRLTRLVKIRAAAGDTDADENARTLVASLDATLDQASALSAAADRSSVSEDIGQALDLITAAEAIADQLMAVLGITDPDDPGVTAGGVHGSYDGMHEHPHSAFGSQGGDATHSHGHAHSGDNSHNHAHGASGMRGASDVEFTKEQQAALRASLGLADDDELTPDVLVSKFSKLAEAAAVRGTQASGRLPDGVVAVDQDVLEDLRRQARSGEEALRRIRVSERDTVINAAVSAGKFPVSRKASYERLWDADPEGTRQVIQAMAKGQVPVEDIGVPGAEDELLDEEYRKLFPPAQQGAQG